MNHDYQLILQVRRHGEYPLPAFPLFRVAQTDLSAMDLQRLVDHFLDRLRDPDTQKDMAVMLANYAKAKSEADFLLMEENRLAFSSMPRPPV